MKSRNKDRKPHESIIGKIIYGFLLFMPLLAIGVTCAYAIFNKNAYQSYYGETINEYSYINVEQIEEGKRYYFYNDGTNVSTSMSTDTISISSVDNINVNDSLYRSYLENAIELQLYFNGEYRVLRTTNSINQQNYIRLYDNTFSFEFEFENGTYNTLINYIKKVQYNPNSYVSEVFYYSIYKVQQSPLFNWAENSTIYTGMTATCNALNITTTFIPLLMTYWLIISVIYILYDIILVILHIFHKKIHQLEDSF